MLGLLDSGLLLDKLLASPLKNGQAGGVW